MTAYLNFYVKEGVHTLSSDEMYITQNPTCYICGLVIIAYVRLHTTWSKVQTTTTFIMYNFDPFSLTLQI